MRNEIYISNKRT